MKNMVLALLSVCLSGCLLNRYEKPPALQKIPFSGFISLTDISSYSSENGIVDEAKISAKFQKTEDSRKFSLIPEKGRGLQCQLTDRENSKPAPLLPVSVGSLSLGTLVSGHGIEIPEVEPGTYQKSLAPHFAPGIYFIRAKGTDKNPAFAAEFSMPEEIRGIRVNGHGLEEGPAIFQKSEDTLVELDPPTAPNDMNIIEFILISQTSEEERALVCAVYEKELEVVNGKQRLEVPSVQLGALSATPNGVLEILRLNMVSGVLQNGPGLRIEGIRAWLWPGWIAE